MNPIKMHNGEPADDDDHIEVRVHGERLDNLDQRVDEHKERIDQIEKQHISELKKEVSDLKVWQGRMWGGMSVLAAAISLFGKRIIDYLWGPK